MQIMANLLRQGRYADEVMGIFGSRRAGKVRWYWP